MAFLFTHRQAHTKLTIAPQSSQQAGIPEHQRHRNDKHGNNIDAPDIQHLHQLPHAPLLRQRLHHGCVVIVIPHKSTVERLRDLHRTLIIIEASVKEADQLTRSIIHVKCMACILNVHDDAPAVQRLSAEGDRSGHDEVVHRHAPVHGGPDQGHLIAGAHTQLL